MSLFLLETLMGWITVIKKKCTLIESVTLMERSQFPFSSNWVLLVMVYVLIHTFFVDCFYSRGKHKEFIKKRGKGSSCYISKLF